MRVKNETLVDPEDQEVMQDEQTDELSSYFKCERIPKVLITTSRKPRSFVSQKSILFLIILFFVNECLMNKHIKGEISMKFRCFSEDLRRF